MYSCDQEHTTARTFGASQPRMPRPLHHSAQTLQLSQASDVASAAVQVQPRRAMKRHARPSRRLSTTVVATDVSNFRAKVQELTGFPPAAIFRPLPRRLHAAGNTFPQAVQHGCGGSIGSSQGHGSDASSSVAGGNCSPDVPTLQYLTQPAECAPPGVFDGLSDLGSPEFDSWMDLAF